MASPTLPRMASSDPAYKLIFSQARMVEDTLRGFLAPEWCDQLDFPTLDRMNAEYVGADLHHRLGDMVWRVEFGSGSPAGGPSLANGERPYLLVLFEFQSGVDPDMAWRMHEYVYLLHRHLRHSGTFKAQGREPPVLPVVVYNGERRWTAAGARPGPVAPPGTAEWIGNEARAYVLLDERARAEEGAGLKGSRLPPDNRMTTLIWLETSPMEARARLLAEAFERYAGEEEKGLREGYHARVKSAGGRYGNEALPRLEELERRLKEKRGGREMATLMEARTREFEERAIARGIAQGREQGIAQGRDEGRREMATLMEARTREFEERAIARGIVQGREQGIAQGIVQGREQGIARGRDEERARLLRLAERRLGPETAAQLSELLADADGADEDTAQTGD